MTNYKFQEYSFRERVARKDGSAELYISYPTNEKFISSLCLLIGPTLKYLNYYYMLRYLSMQRSTQSKKLF